MVHIRSWSILGVGPYWGPIFPVNSCYIRKLKTQRTYTARRVHNVAQIRNQLHVSLYMCIRRSSQQSFPSINDVNIMASFHHNIHFQIRTLTIVSHTKTLFMLELCLHYDSLKAAHTHCILKWISISIISNKQNCIPQCIKCRVPVLDGKHYNPYHSHTSSLRFHKSRRTFE